MILRNFIKRNLKQTTLSNLLLLLTASLIALIIAEFITRTIEYSRKLPRRYLFRSLPLFETDAQGAAVSFAKNTLVREVAVYNDAIEYDMIYQINNYGSADTIDYEKNNAKEHKARSIAIVGNSFAAGSGGGMWVPELRKKLLSAHQKGLLYNFSLPGATPWHFVRMLAKAAQDFTFTDIVLLVISDDIGREDWNFAIQDNATFSISKERENLGVEFRKLTAHIIDFHEKQSEILKRVKLLEKSGRIKDFFAEFSLKPRILSLIKQALSSALFRKQKRKIDPLILMQFQKIRALFPRSRIYFVYLPQKDEIAAGKYRFDLKDSIESIGIQYVPAFTQSRWSLDMFYKNDSHPNTLGYKAIAAFIEERILNRDYNTSIAG